MIYNNFIWNRKPRLGARLDKKSTILNNIGGFYAFNEGGGSVLNDSTKTLSLPIISGAVWSVSNFGSQLNFTSAGVGATAILPVVLQGLQDFTFVIAYQQLFSNNEGPVFLFAQSNGTVIGGLNSNGNNIFTQFYDGSSHFGSPQSLTLGKSYVVGGSFKDGAQPLYINGSLVTTANASGPIAWSSNSQIVLGPAMSQFSSFSNNLQIYWAAWWKRSLSDAEHSILGSHPDNVWQFFEPQINPSVLYQRANSPPPITTNIVRGVLIGNDQYMIGNNLIQYHTQIMRQ